VSTRNLYRSIEPPAPCPPLMKVIRLRSDADIHGLFTADPGLFNTCV
jgi:hypothetical protein